MSEGRWPHRDVLEELVSPRRVAKIDQVLGSRLVSVTAVFEDLYDPHNVAAGMRNCDAFGLHDVHVVTSEHQYRIDGDVAASSDRWLSVHRYPSTSDCIAALRTQGFEIWVSDLQATQTLDELPMPDKLALVVGREKQGISDEIRAAADRRYILPMHGMVQSFNVSVALAISLQTVVPKRRAQLGQDGDMPPDQQWRLRRRWLVHGIREPRKMRAAYGDPLLDQDP